MLLKMALESTSSQKEENIWMLLWAMNHLCEIEDLTGIAMSYPQAAYAALTYGLMGRWSYTIQTIPDMSDLFATS